MRPRHLCLLLSSVLIFLPSIVACSNGLSGNDSTADDQAAASMSSTEAGATYAVEGDVEETAAGTTQTSATITIVIDPATYSVTYYDGLNGSGATLGTNPGTIPVLWKSAVVVSTRPYSVTAQHGDGSSVIKSSITINNLAASSGLYTIAGSVEVDRTVTLSNGTTITTKTMHTLSYSVSATSGAIQKGGTASTTCTASINGGSGFTRTYSWYFEGNGTAVLTTERGTTLTVTVE